MAGIVLSESNRKILVLEGRDRIGGRIHSINYGGRILEAGAEFIHGDLPLTKGLLKQSSIEFVKVRGKMYQSFQSERAGQYDWGKGWEQLMKAMKDLKKDMPLRDFLDTNFPGEKYKSLRRSVKGFAEGFDLADIADASTKCLYNEWCHEDEEQFRIPAGYGELMDWMADKMAASGAVLLKNQAVREVKWERDYFRVLTSGGQEFTGKKLLVTIPSSLMQNQSLPAAIHFDPPVTDQIRMYERIGFGKLVKLVFLFREDFWESSHKNLGFVFSDQPIPTWWTQLPSKTGVLTGWWGNPPRELTGSKDSIAELGIQSISGIFSNQSHIIRGLLEAQFVFDWQKEIFSQGAYSYPKPGSLQAIKELKKPVDNCLFFAGEAIFEGDSPGTVEAALHSGRESALAILQSVG